VRAAVLVLLDEEARNGYQLMQEIEQRSGGFWRPSPGSVYPTLQQLEDEGLVSSGSQGGGRVFTLTDAGRAHVAEHRDQLGTPWEAASDTVNEDLMELHALLAQVAEAVRQVAHAGAEAQVAEAKKTLTATRRTLYRILAEDEPEDATD
jgi:DNA-binding PadR family transcriptional regulator